MDAAREVAVEEVLDGCPELDECGVEVLLGYLVDQSQSNTHEEALQEQHDKAAKYLEEVVQDYYCLDDQQGLCEALDGAEWDGSLADDP